MSRRVFACRLCSIINMLEDYLYAVTVDTSIRLKLKVEGYYGKDEFQNKEKEND